MAGALMPDHVAMAVSDLPRAARLHDAVTAALRVPRVWRGAGALGHGTRSAAEGDGHACPTTRATGAPIDADRRPRCFRAPDRASVGAFHAAGLAHGGTDGGAPGLRPHCHARHRAAFLLDPDGNRVEAAWRRSP